VIHVPLERVGYCSMKIGSILNFDEWARTDNLRSTNLRKVEVVISICSKVMSQILTAVERAFVNFTLSRIFFKLSLLIFSIPVFDAKLNSASNGDSFYGVTLKNLSISIEILRFWAFSTTIHFNEQCTPLQIG
jgi:hypothetical protein